ncbi:hypothetical protein CC78DRAFT_582566 [Lojkania enalia]|uniref:Uncharacterized protein n=1 Tax=Lojkania enalia TaxID=147567 RepID=A0A9P4N1K7_9PLEO|nr:hypothetical protein CC78DRAFT_582566 [Didymosphaeria enalia]
MKRSKESSHINSFLENVELKAQFQKSPNMAQIDERLPYRIGLPLLPVLPVQTFPLANVADQFPGASNHRRVILEILDNNRVHVYHSEIVYRLHAGDKLSDDYITIMTVARFWNGCIQSWKDATMQIHQYLSEFNLHYAIEIIDFAAYRGLQSLPFPTDIYNWNRSLLPLVQSLVDRHQWITINMLYQEYVEGRREDQASTYRPTVIVTARDANDSSWWNKTLPTLRTALQKYPEIRFEVLYEQHFIIAASPNSKLLSQAFSNVICSGSSCGNGTRTGTLGGQIYLKESKGTTIKLGITNHHVLAYKLNSKEPSTSFLADIPVECPSNEDTEFQVATEEVAIEQQNRMIAQLESQLLGGENVDGLSSEIAKAKTYREELNERKTRYQDFNRTMGKVYATSGLRIRENTKYDKSMSESWALDWCLSTIVPPRILLNMFGGPGFPARTVDKYCEINPNQGYRVFKQGRTSGATTGYISATQSLVRRAIPEPENGSTVMLADLSMFPEPVRCHAMIGERGPRGISAKFIEPGDSGSLVLLDPSHCMLKREGTEIAFRDHKAPNDSDNLDWIPLWDDDALRAVKAGPAGIHKGKEKARLNSDEAIIVGLAFGNSDGCLVSYMTPIDLVVRDIELVTSGTVLEPRFAGLVNTPNHGQRITLPSKFLHGFDSYLTTPLFRQGPVLKARNPQHKTDASEILTDVQNIPNSYCPIDATNVFLGPSREKVNIPDEMIPLWSG